MLERHGLDKEAAQAVLLKGAAGSPLLQTIMARVAADDFTPNFSVSLIEKDLSYAIQEGAKAGITVNAICPGYLTTEMVQAVPKDVLEKSILPLIPIGRLGEPEEIARCVVFLASDDAGLMTGTTLSANGGQYFA